MEGRLGSSVNKHCSSCASACCGPNINIELSNQERDFLQSAGTYIVYLTDKHAAIGHSFYILKSKCGFVVNEEGLQKCSAYDNPQRPAICGSFEAGGKICKEIKDSRKAGMGYEFGY